MKRFLGVLLTLVLVLFLVTTGVIAANADETELSYDDDEVDFGWATGPFGGGAVLFTPPEIPWLLTRIKVMASYTLNDAPFFIEIWDNNQNELFTGTYMYSDYFTSNMMWAEIDIPDIVVNGDFYVGVFGNWAIDHVLGLGYDADPPVSNRSFAVRYDNNAIDYPENWNWMIRAIGTSMTSTQQINIRAYIDGRSRLILRANTVQWQHIDYAAPGRHGFANLPTIINGVEWYPVWPDIPDAENRDCGCYSSTYEGLMPALPDSDTVINLNVIQARYLLSIEQYPSSTNNYTLILDFNDNLPSDAEWYECEIAFDLPPEEPPPEEVEVGGEVYTISRLNILMPWIALAAIILAGTIVVVRYRRIHN